MDNFTILCVILILIGLIPATIAHNKGKSFVGWWILGTLAFIIALPAALLLKKSQDVLKPDHIEQGKTRKCPYCSKTIEEETRICKYCNKYLPKEGDSAIEAGLNAEEFSQRQLSEESDLRKIHAKEQQELQLSQQEPREQITHLTHRIRQLEQEVAAQTTNLSRQVKQKELQLAQQELEGLQEGLLDTEKWLLSCHEKQMRALKAHHTEKVHAWEIGHEVEQMVVELLTEVANIKDLKKTRKYENEVLFSIRNKRNTYPIDGRNVVVVRESLTSWVVKGEGRNRCVLIFSVTIWNANDANKYFFVEALSDSSEEANIDRKKYPSLYSDITKLSQMKSWTRSTKDLSRDELEKALIEVTQKVQEVGPCSYESACACTSSACGPHPFGVCGMAALHNVTDPYFLESTPAGIGMPSTFLHTVSAGDKVMVYHSLLGNLRYAEPDILKFLNLVAPGISMPELTPHFPEIDLQAELDTLLRLRFLVYGSEDQILRSQIQHSKGAYYRGEQIRTLRLNTATDCNLACTYCHGTNDDGKVQRMSLDTATRAIRLYTDLLLEHNQPLMQIRYFGGEPFLNWPVLRDSLSFACEIAQQHKLGLTVIVNTNATLFTPTIINELKLYRSNLNVVVSLDGPVQSHDAARKYHNGKGSFDQVCKGLDLLQTADIPISISTTLGAHNQKHLRELVDLLQARGIHWMGVNPIGILPDESTPASLATDLIDVIDYAGARNFHVSGLWQGVCDRLYGGTTGSYCGGNGGELSILPGGEVFPCQAQPIKLGTLDDVETKELFNSMAYSKVAMRVVGNLPECSGCEIEGMCAGGCAADAHACSGGIYGRTQYCEFLKTIARRYLERLALLAQGTDTMPYG